MSIIIRQARKDELDILHDFEAKIIEIERPLDPTLREDAYHYYDLPKLFDDANAAIFVAEAQGEVIGSANVTIRDAKHYNNIKNFAHIGLVYVTPEYRGKKIVTMLFDAMKEWAMEKGLTELRLQVFDKNIPAVKAYEKYGFSKNLVEMRMSLEE